MPRLQGSRGASAWAAAGAAGYGAGQLLYFVLVAKLCAAEDLGRFALAIAWATPAMLAARMQMRYVLAADASGALPFGLAARARLISAGAMLAVLSSAALLAATPATAWTLVLVALIRAAEDAGDLLLGVAQRAGRWPAIALSLALRGLGGATVLGLSLLSFGELRAALAAVLGWQVAVTFFHDWRAVRSGVVPLERLPWREALGAVRAHAALGGAAALVSLNAYLPRYAVERFLGLEAVGVYTALAQLALLGNVAVQAVGQAAVTPLGAAFHGDRRAFVRCVAELLAFAAAAGVGGLALAITLGPQALALLYRPEHAAHAPTLVYLMAAAALTYLTAVLGYALVAAGERRAQLRIFGFSAVIALGASVVATPLWGLEGAAGALAASWAVAVAGAALALRRRLRACPQPEPSPKLSPWPLPDSARPGAAR